MATTLIISAAPDPGSFTAQWAAATASAARALGHEVLSSDLVAMGFDPVERADHFGASGPFDPLKAQERAAADGTLPAEISEEVEKVRAADLIVLHFPVWWFSPPAILKGWCDRALVHGALHDVDHRFDAGNCRGKTLLACVTTGASAAECGPDGKEGDIRLVLWPLFQTFRYLGCAVAEPVLVHGVHGYFEGAEKAALESRLSGVLAGQAALLATLPDRPRLPFNADTDFDAAGRLRPGAPSHWPFIRPSEGSCS